MINSQPASCVSTCHRGQMILLCVAILGHLIICCIMCDSWINIKRRLRVIETNIYIRSRIIHRQTRSSKSATVPYDVPMQICMLTSMLVYKLFFIFVCMPRVSMPVNRAASTVVMPTSVPSSILSCKTFHAYSISMPAPQLDSKGFRHRIWDHLGTIFGIFF